MNDMTKVKNVDFIENYDDIIPDDYCNRMIAKFTELEKSSSLRVASGSKDNGPGARKDYAFYFCHEENNALNLHQETNAFLDIGLQRYIDSHPSLESLQFFSHNCKVQRTPPKGGFHAWHCERGGHNYANRMLVWTIYLNDIPEGEGETEFLEFGLKIPAKKGRMCFFPADWTHTHRGNAVYTHDKYIATGWYYILDN